MTDSRPPAYYEDFAVGQVYASGATRITRARMVAFAEEFDPQPAHLDEAAAIDTQFGRLVASGWFTAAVSMRLLIVEALPPMAGGGVGAGVEELAWPLPVLPDDTLRLRVEITGARMSRSHPDKGLLTMLATVTNQDDQVVLRMTSTVVVLTRPLAT